MARYTPEKRINLLQEWQASGKSAPQWCKENGICYQTFAYWRQKATLPEDTSFVEVVETRKHTPKEPLEVVFGDYIIKLSADFDEQTFLRCLAALRQVSC